MVLEYYRPTNFYTALKLVRVRHILTLPSPLCHAMRVCEGTSMHAMRETLALAYQLRPSHVLAYARRSCTLLPCGRACGRACLVTLSHTHSSHTLLSLCLTHTRACLVTLSHTHSSHTLLSLCLTHTRACLVTLPHTHSCPYTQASPPLPALLLHTHTHTHTHTHSGFATPSHRALKHAVATSKRMQAMHVLAASKHTSAYVGIRQHTSASKSACKERACAASSR
jgi:hypothetical protein